MPIETILLIDDCDDYRDITATLLRASGYNVYDACCPHDAWQLLPHYSFDLILCDLHMPFITGERSAEFQTSFNVGIMCIQELQDLFPETPILGVSSTDESDLYKIRKFLKGIQVVTKPRSKEELLMLVKTHDSVSGIIESNVVSFPQHPR